MSKGMYCISFPFILNLETKMKMNYFPEFFHMGENNEKLTLLKQI